MILTPKNPIKFKPGPWAAPRAWARRLLWLVTGALALAAVFAWHGGTSLTYATNQGPNQAAGAVGAKVRQTPAAEIVLETIGFTWSASTETNYANKGIAPAAGPDTQAYLTSVTPGVTSIRYNITLTDPPAVTAG